MPASRLVGPLTGTVAQDGLPGAGRVAARALEQSGTTAQKSSGDLVDTQRVLTEQVAGSNVSLDSWGADSRAVLLVDKTETDVHGSPGGQEVERWGRCSAAGGLG